MSVYWTLVPDTRITMRFPAGFLEEIRARLPASAVVGRRVKLRKEGKEFRGQYVVGTQLLSENEVVSLAEEKGFQPYNRLFDLAS